MSRLVPTGSISYALALTFAVSLSVAPKAGAAESATYPNAALLVEPAELAKSAAVEARIVLDARPRAKYDAGHIPGARWVDHDAWSKGVGAGDDVAAWSKRIGDLGIGAKSSVVVYDDNLAKDSARIWWALRYWGVEQVALLNGGWTGWQAGKHPVQTEAPKFAAVAFEAKPVDRRLATKGEVLASLKDGSLQIVDARSEKEFCGIEKGKNKKAGAIPGAKHLEWVDLIDQPTQRFKPAAELKKLFDEAGIALDRPTASHCQGGGRASVLVFGLELMGAQDVGNYYASWGEWGNAEDTPVVAGQPKAKP